MPVRGPLRPNVHRNASPSTNMWEMERRYSVPAQELSVIGSDSKLQRRSHMHHHTGTLPNPNTAHPMMTPSASEDLHAWSIYRLIMRQMLELLLILVPAQLVYISIFTQNSFLISQLKYTSSQTRTDSRHRLIETGLKLWQLLFNKYAITIHVYMLL